MWLKRTLLLMLMVLLVLPAIQKVTGFYRCVPLNNPGAGVPEPEFTFNNWFSGDFQRQYQDHLRDSSGFREIMVRSFNQADYTMFSIPHARMVVAGKKGYLFEEQYILSYLGRNFAGYDPVDLNAKLLREVQDSLLKWRNIHLVVIFTPGKGWFYPEYIPSRFQPWKKETDNLEAFRTSFDRYGINYIDFNEWFLQMKDTSRHVLYPKTGIHWSAYGGLLAADSLARYLRQKAGLLVPRIMIDSLELSDTARFEDNDIERGMNLLRRISAPPLTYAKYRFTGVADSLKPSALFIGDSFYWTWYWPGIITGIFSNRDFLYYNKQVYPQSFDREVLVKDTDLLSLVERQQVVILMQTNAGYGNPGYGFATDMLEALKGAGDLVARMKKRIRSNSEWMEMIARKAAEKGISLEEMLHRDALYMVEKEKHSK